MINRVLIRIKVVQLLYSTFLTETAFRLESMPSPPTKEKRFAYSLYLFNLGLFCSIAEKAKTKTKNGILLSETRLIKKLLREPELKPVIEDLKKPDAAALAEKLSEQITASSIFKDYVKNYPQEENDKLWENLYNIIIRNDRDYLDYISALQNYTLGGVDRMNGLMETTFKNFYVTQDNLEDSLKILESSLSKSRELYMRLLALPIDLTYLRDQQLDENRHKYLVTDSDLNPNKKFIGNKLVRMLAEEESLKEYLDKHKISWLAEDRDLLKSLLKEITDSNIYQEYMENDNLSLKDDVEFWREIYKHVIFTSEHFLEYMENKSVFWNDDLDIIGTFILKTFKRFDDPESQEEKILPMYKDEIDAKFGSRLFSYVVKNKDTYRGYIDNAIIKDKWESDRLAFMDVVVMMTALAEIINFPEIPLAATINEYIEIAKSYSTNKSGSFINGFLGTIITNLRAEGKILK